jgi:DNA-binding transcriptional ArsR family regulator
MAVSLAETEVVFAALAHRARRNILVTLHHMGGELPSGYLAKRFAHSWPTTTRHLNVLQEAGLVEVRREGRSSYYRLNGERIDRVVGGFLRLFTPADSDKTWEPTGPRSSRQLGEDRSRRNKKRKGGQS